MRLLARDISMPSHRVVLRSAAALVLAVASSPILPAQAQDPYPDLDDIGLVMHVHMESVAPHLGHDSGNDLVELASRSPLLSDILTSSMFFSTENLEEEDEEGESMVDLLNPSPSERDLLIRVKDARMRVDMGTSGLLARLDTLDRSVLEWGVLDPGSGRVVDSQLFDAAVREGSSAPYDAVGSGGDVQVLETRGPTQTDEFAQIAGHTARRYDFGQEINVFPLGTDGSANPVVRIERSSRAWIAETGPYVNDPDASAASRQFTRGMPPELARLASGGLLLGADDESTITVGMATIDGASGGSLEASSSFRVTRLSREVVDDALLAGFEQDEQACDCSCDGYRELMSLTEEDPNAMGKAMCAMDCASKWRTNQCTK